MYRLGFPNREVEEGFVRFLLPFYANVNKVESPFEIQKFVREVRFGDYDSFFRRLQSFFADTTNEVIREQELHYENVLFIVFKFVGFYTQVEYHTTSTEATTCFFKYFLPLIILVLQPFLYMHVLFYFSFCI